MIKPPQKPMTSTISKNDKTELTTSVEDVANVALSEPSVSPVKFDVTKEISAHVAALSDAELESTLKTLRTEARRRDKERESLRPKVGSKVRILKGRPKFVGKEGTAIIVRKSRCFITVPGINAPAYVLISDLELVER